MSAPVVVGVGDTGSAAAVEWAAAEAAAASSPLHLVHVTGPHLLAEAYGAVSPMTDTTSHRAARLILEEALTTARLTASDLEVSTHLLPGPTAPALLDEARDARLLVVGSGRRRGLSARLHGSVANFVALHSPRPVVVIHPVSADRPPVRSMPRVVVGIGPSSRPATVGFAFDAARQRGVPLVALSAWTPDTPVDFGSWPDQTISAREAAASTLEQALTPWRPRFPSISVTPRLVCGDPVDALLAASSGAALVVVGSGPGPLRRLLFGSVSRAVLKRASCAVAVVRSATASVPTAANPASDEHA